MAGSTEMLAAFRELTNAKQLDRNELKALLEDGIHAALARKFGPNVKFEMSVDELRGGIRVVRLRQEVQGLSSPQLNAPIVDLYPSSTYRSEAEPGPSLTLPPQVRLFTLILNPPATAPAHPRYAVEVIRADGGLVWRGNGLRRNAFGSLVLTLPRRLVGPGHYRVRLHGSDAGAAEPIDEFPLWIEAE